MVIVLSDEQSVIDEPHRRSESRVESRARKECRISVTQQLDKLVTRGPKAGKKLGEVPRVVIRVVSLSVRQIRCSELGLT